MKEKEIDIKGRDVNVITDVPKEYIEDNNLKIFLDDTIDLGEVVSKVNTNEIVNDDKK